MPNRILPPLRLLAFAVVLANGCSSARTETYDIDVHNGTPSPLTLSLAKDGPPYEAVWATPEELAQETPRYREEWKNGPSGMGALPPGKTASVRKVVGRFDSGSRGYLRVYAGDLEISQMLSKGAGSPDRVDVPLSAGMNDVTIVLERTRLKAQLGATPAPPAAAQPVGSAP